MKRSLYMSIAVLTALVLSGCGSTNSTDTTKSNIEVFNQNEKNLYCETTDGDITPIGVRVLQPKDISEKSKSNYSCNDHGVISSYTLTNWLENWKETKPKGVEGRLIVLQAGAVSFDDNRTFLPHNDKDVLVYGIPGGGACDPSYKRFDGISQTPGAMVAGENIDGNINFFQIDPKKDFVVFAVAEGSTTIREITRTWWSMIYWGWDMERIAFLNGSVAYNYAGCKDYLVASPSPLPQITNQYHMSDLKTDRTSLHMYIDEMRDIAKKDDKTGYFIADARGTGEYDGSKLSKTASKNCGQNHDKQCYSAFRGHIRDAVDFPYTDILVMDDEFEDLNGDGKIDKKDASFKFKSFDELKTLYAKKGYKEGDMILTYCRTGRKATLLTLTATTVLGYPIRMYDGSWMQWGVMSNTKDTNDKYILPEDSVLRTDTDEYSVVLGYNNSIDVESSETYEIDLNSTLSQDIKEEDKAYLENN
jgi:3-mercaptopyruvate sulfurtransferase SseA